MARTFRSLMGLAAAVLLLGLVVRAFTSPVLFRFKKPGATDPGDDLYVVFSPVRDRAPERIGNGVLSRLQRGECDTFIETRFCDEEKKFTPVHWELLDRTKQSDGTVLLHYKVTRTTYRKGVSGNVWITVAEAQDGWSPISYEHR